MLSETDRLSATIQTDQEESEIFIRSQEVRDQHFSFLGFEFRRVRSRRGAWRAWYPPLLKKRTALLRKLKD